MSDRFPKYVQIYEPFTLQDQSGNNITFSPGGTLLNHTDVNGIVTKIVTLNSYSMTDFMSELDSVFDVSYVVQDDELVTRQNISTAIDADYGLNVDSGSTGAPHIKFKHSDGSRYSAALTTELDSLNIQSDTSIVFSSNSDLSPTSQQSMVIDASGYVGIGSDAPTCPLHIFGTDICSNSISIDHSTNNVSIQCDTTAPTANSIIGLNENAVIYGTSTLPSSLSICPKSTTSGGIKLDGSGHLSVYGNLNIKNKNNANSWQLDMLDNPNNDLRIQTNTFTPLTLDISHGNVGIGTTSPEQRCHIYDDASGTTIVMGETTAGNKACAIEYVASSQAGSDPSRLVMRHGTDDDASTFTIQSGGNIGLGTVDPKASTHMYGDASGTHLMLGLDLSANLSAGIEYFQGNLDTSASMYVGHYDTILNSGINISNNGYVGVGISTPIYPIHIAGWQSAQSGAGGNGTVTNPYYGFDGTTGGNFSERSTMPNISLYAEGGVFASILGIHSDRRIKRDITSILPTNSIELMRELNPVTYNFIDQHTHGYSTMYGFIAQETKAIVPESCSMIENTVPNIYDLASIELHTGIVVLKHKTTASFYSKTPTIVVYDESGRKYIVACTYIIDDKSFIVNCSQLKENNPSNIFVYGEQVYDFHVLNPEVIHTLSVSAIQELDKELTDAKNIISEHESRIQSLEQKVDELMSLIKG